MTIKYFAVCDANGLISQELTATTLPDAIREVDAAIEDRAAVDWINDSQTDLEEQLGIKCDDMSYSQALAKCAEAGAEFAIGHGSGDTWDIWSVNVKDAVRPELAPGIEPGLKIDIYESDGTDGRAKGWGYTLHLVHANARDGDEGFPSRYLAKRAADKHAVTIGWKK